MSSKQSKRAAFAAKQRRLRELRELRRTYGARLSSDGYLIGEPMFIDVTRLTDSVVRRVRVWG